jgi:hypothetical protein
MQRLDIPIFELQYEGGITYETKFDSGRISVRKRTISDLDLERKLSFLTKNITVIVEDEHSNSVRTHVRYERRGSDEERFIPILRGILADSDGDIDTENCVIDSVSFRDDLLKFRLSRINLIKDSDMF